MFRNVVSFVGALVIAAGALLGAQSAQSPASGQNNNADQAFASQSAIAGMAEVELGKMAMQQGSNARVKQFGQMMVTDHTKAGDELKTIAKTKNMTLPTMLDPMHQATRDKLAKLSGTEFDRAYMEAMVTGHQTVENNMRTEADRGADPQFKAFAAKALPTVQSHLKMALEIQKEVSAASKK
jgi:putative membrane protein